MTCLLLLTVFTTPASAFLNFGVNVEINVEGVREAAQSLDRLTRLVDELTDQDPNKGRLLKLLAAVKADVNGIIVKAGKELRETGRDISRQLLTD